MDTSEVEGELKRLALQLRKQFLAIPDRVSELFASIEDSNEIRNTLIEELTHVLTGFKYDIKSDTGKKLPENSQ